MAMQFSTPPSRNEDMMDLDLDIEMDLGDVGPMGEQELFEEGEEGELPSEQVEDVANIIPAIYTEDPSQEPQREKIHIRGLDDLHNNDILAFANDYFPSVPPSHVQWIDDTSANIIYPSAEIALQAFMSFTSSPVSAASIRNAPFELHLAKSLASRPSSRLEIRIAKVSDKKQKGARDASRYYLLNPDKDPTERMRREFRENGGRLRTGEHGDYQRRRFDDREHRRRRDHDRDGEGGADFAASMYDDNPESAANEDPSRSRDLFSRVSGGRRGVLSRRRSASPGALSRSNSDSINLSDSDEDGGRAMNRRRRDYREREPPPYSRRDPNPFPAENIGKELLPDHNTRPNEAGDGGRLRSDHLELFPASVTATPSSSGPPSRNAGRHSDNLAAAHRLKADLIASSQTSPGRATHRRSHAMDAKNAEDLSERFGRKGASIDETKNNFGKELFGDELMGGTDASTSGGNGSGGGGGLNIRGASQHGSGLIIKGAGGLSIKGRAANTRELFPEQYDASRLGGVGGGSSTGNESGGGGGAAAAAGGDNRGKELFDHPVRERRVRERAW